MPYSPIPMQRWLPLSALVLSLIGAATFLSVDEAFSAMPGTWLLNMAAAALLALHASRWLWSRKQWPVYELLMLGAGVATAMITLRAAEVFATCPIVLQEGTGETIFQAMYAHGGHAWPSFHSIAMALADGRPPVLGLIEANVVMAAMSAALFAIVSHQITGSKLAGALLAIIFFGNTDMRAAMFSETAAPLSWIYLLSGCAGWAGWRDNAAPRLDRIVGLALLSVATVLLVGTRPEVGAVGLAALAAIVIEQLAGPQVDGFMRRWRQLLRTRQANAWVALLGLAGALALITRYMLALELEHSQYARWAIWGLAPLNPSVIDLPLLLTGWLPPAVVGLFLVGLCVSIARPLHTAMIGLALIICFRVHEAASHRCYFEMMRYMTFVTPIALLLAALGWRTVSDRWQNSDWGPANAATKRKLSAAVLSLTLLLPPIAGLHDLYVPDHEQGQRRLQHQDNGGLSAAHPLQMIGPCEVINRNQQRAAAVLSATIRSSPCILVARVVAGQYGVAQPANDDFVIVADGLIVERWRADRAPIAAVLAQLQALGHCGVYYRGLDCHFQPGSRCDRDVDGLTMSKGSCAWPNAPYSDIHEYGRHIATIAIRTYTLGRSMQFDCSGLSTPKDGNETSAQTVGSRPLRLPADLRQRLSAVIPTVSPPTNAPKTVQ